jgi:hypothetical protein
MNCYRFFLQTFFLFRSPLLLLGAALFLFNSALVLLLFEALPLQLLLDAFLLLKFL